MHAPRILYLVPDLFGPPGGIARHGRSVCQALIDSRIDLSVLALLDDPDVTQTICGLSAHFHYETCQGNRRLFVAKALQAIKMRPKLILVEHPNFAHLGWAVARLSCAPLVIICHGIDVWQPLSFLRRKALASANRVLCVSSFTAQKVEQFNEVRPQSIRVLHNCLEPNFEIQPHRAVQDNNKKPSLLTVARLSLSEQYKGHDYVIGALPQLRKGFPDLIYDIVGEGDWRPHLEGLAAQKGVSDMVRFHGKVAEDELSKFYSHAAIFIMPSRGEGFGIAFLEAMRYSVPVIGGNVDASPEVISDSETGFVVDPTSVEAISKAVSRLLSDSDLRRRMGAAGLERAVNHFSFETFRTKLLKYLSEVEPSIVIHSEQAENVVTRR